MPAPSLAQGSKSPGMQQRVSSSCPVLRHSAGHTIPEGIPFPSCSNPSSQFPTETLPAESRMPGVLQEGAFLRNQIAAVCSAIPERQIFLFQPQGFSQQPFPNSSELSRAGWSLHTNPYPSQLLQGVTDFIAPQAFSSQITPGMQDSLGITAPLLPHTEASCGTIPQTYYIEILILKLKIRRSLEKV